jgi:hypothetical protein
MDQIKTCKRLGYKTLMNCRNGRRHETFCLAEIEAHASEVVGAIEANYRNAPIVATEMRATGFQVRRIFFVDGMRALEGTCPGESENSLLLKGGETVACDAGKSIRLFSTLEMARAELHGWYTDYLQSW